MFEIKEFYRINLKIHKSYESFMTATREWVQTINNESRLRILTYYTEASEIDLLLHNIPYK